MFGQKIISKPCFGNDTTDASTLCSSTCLCTLLPTVRSRKHQSPRRRLGFLFRKMYKNHVLGHATTKREGVRKGGVF